MEETALVSQVTNLEDNNSTTAKKYGSIVQTIRIFPIIL